MNSKIFFKSVILSVFALILASNAYALSKQDKAMQQQLLSNYALNSKYCDFYSDTKDATINNMSQWKIICTAPDKTIISSYSYIDTSEPNLAILWQSQFIQQYGQPFMVKGRMGHIKMLWSKNKDEDIGLYFQAVKGNGHLITLIGDYNKHLTKHYKGTLLTWN